MDPELVIVFVAFMSTLNRSFLIPYPTSTKTQIKLKKTKRYWKYFNLLNSFSKAFSNENSHMKKFANTFNIHIFSDTAFSVVCFISS
jgi:hypothetical protein